MVKTTVIKIRKRDGRIVKFNPKKIIEAIFKAAHSVGGNDHKRAEWLTDKVIERLEAKYDGHTIPSVEEIQDITEEVLMRHGHAQTTRAYILYRDLRNRARSIHSLIDVDELIGDYLSRLDWRVKENSNMAYSLQGLNNHVASIISASYWLNKIYPKEVREAHLNGDLHIHNLQILAAYCCGWDLKDLLIKGFGGVPGKIECKPPKHLRTALGQLVNFTYTLQGEAAGAQAVSSFDTLLAPFIREDKLSYQEVKQALQEFIFNMNVPTRVGFQTPFSNITLDLEIPNHFKKEPIIIGGKPQSKTYGDFQKEVNIFNKAFAEVMLEGDAKGRVFTFPIPTYNITRDFNWDSPVYEGIWEMTRKYGIPYFSNFINSDLKPEDVRSMCCRLRLRNDELRMRGGGLFGANPLTGSLGVITINLPRIGYLSKSKKEYFERLSRMMDLAKTALILKRKIIEQYTDEGLYPYSKVYLSGIKKRMGEYWKNHFNTIGIIGMNESLLNFIRKNIAQNEGRDFTIEVMDFMRQKLIIFQKETDQMFNLEATPAEGTSYQLAKMDKKAYPDIIVANKEEVKTKKAEPYYTNSTHLPVNYTDDIFEALDLQDELQTKYTGGCIEDGNKVLTDKGLLNIEYIVKNFEGLKSIKALSYNQEKGISEWDEIVEAVSINVKKENKIRVRGERNLDIVTSDWHPFFVLEKVKVNSFCPVCQKRIKNIKQFATHLRYNPLCRQKYSHLPKYEVIEKRADELKKEDYILQNSYNLYPDKKTELNNDLMWLIGLFIGDGCISEFVDNRGGNKLRRYKIRFFSSNQKILEKAKGILSKYFHTEANVIQNDKRSKVLRELSTSKKEVSDFFFKYGFKEGKKVYEVSIPLKVKENLNKGNIFSLLSGLLAGDGFISKRDGDFEYYTVSFQLADDILEIGSRAGIMISKAKKPTKRENEVSGWRLRIPSYQVTEIKDKLSKTFGYSGIKKDLSNRKKRHLPVVRIKEVSKTDVKDNQFYDLMTKKNHNYLAGKNSLVFIHNTVLHGFLGESLPDVKSVKKLVKTIAQKYKLPYYTLTPTFSICPTHGYLFGEHKVCGKCGQTCEVWSRVVGYLRPVMQWNAGKQEEFKDRKTYTNELPRS